MAYALMNYDSPLGKITLCDNDVGICGAWIEGQKFFGRPLDDPQAAGEASPVPSTENLKAAKAWLDDYFAGKKPTPDQLNLAPEGTDFQKAVWRELVAIPYGKTTTYGEIAKRLEAKTGKHTASIAVGGAVGHNPISIIVPCHRVIGAGGNLTGYAGGLDKKVWLLEHEQVDMDGFYRPKKGTAL